MAALSLHVGVKSDPIEYRYSFPWLFGLMEECGVRFLQLGTFFELYHLPDRYFIGLREQAERHGIAISSVFTSHRELGGFFRGDSDWVAVARRNYERLIEVGALVGAESVGSNPGSILRDEMAGKAAGIATFVAHMKELMAYAAQVGVRRLTMEPMSCLAEPPTLPEEMAHMMHELRAHRGRRLDCADVGLCADVSHGYADVEGHVVADHLDLLSAALPYVTELHLKNTDRMFGSTFGFSAAERERGIVDLAAVRRLLVARQAELPTTSLIGYLEIGGPKLGRDYSDRRLGDDLRVSLSHCREAFEVGAEG